MRSFAYVLIIAATWTIAVACGSDESTPADSANDTDAGADGGAGGEGSTDPPDPDPCVPEPEDPIDPEDQDQNCDGVDGVAEDNVYVSLTGDNSNLGTREAPFRTIQHALDVAAGRPVFVASGTYEEDLTVTTDKLMLLGGYTPESGWRRVSEDDRSLLRVPSEGLRVRELTEDSMIGGMQIEAEPADEDSPGASSFALSVGGSGTPTVFVWKSNILAGRGAPGENGADGADHPEGDRDSCIPAGVATGEACRRSTPQGTSGGSACQCGELETDQVAPGGRGCGDTRSRGGDGGIAAVSPGRGGAGVDFGRNGQVGVQGEGAAPVESIGAFALDGYEPSQGTAASPGQSGGGGGGGLVGGVLSAVAEHELCGLTPPCGGCGATCSEFPYPEEDPDNPEVGRGWCSEQSADPTCVRCIGCPGAEIARPGGGAGGGGACGGQEGMSGTSGGASVGVIAEGVLLQFQDVHISADAGGRGGNGGNGGLAAPGECGGLGAQGSCVLAEASLCSSGPLGGVPRRVMQCRRGGEAGGNGGRGGPGGNGAGGSGGPSIGVVLLDGASLEETGSLYETEPSDPGEGGMTGSTPGPSGEPGMGEACWPSDTCP